MRILAVTCYTGGEDLVKMTEQAIAGMKASIPKGVMLRVSATKQGAVREAKGTSFTHHCPRNVGFAFGMNQAIEAGLSLLDTWDYVLCFNNDLVFSKSYWLERLLEEPRKDRILVPATDRTAIRTQAKPIFKSAFDVQEMSAYCWLVPMSWCEHLMEHHNFWLFDEEFKAYGEDNWTAFLLSKAFGPKIFRYVPSSWVHHKRHQTSAVVKPNRKASNQLLVDRLRKELKDPKLRGDLRAWARRYVEVLSRRL